MDTSKRHPYRNPWSIAEEMIERPNRTPIEHIDAFTRSVRYMLSTGEMDAKGRREIAALMTAIDETHAVAAPMLARQQALGTGMIAVLAVLAPLVALWVHGLLSVLLPLLAVGVIIGAAVNVAALSAASVTVERMRVLGSDLAKYLDDRQSEPTGGPPTNLRLDGGPDANVSIDDVLDSQESQASPSERKRRQ